eukprot:scaffold7685_cov103-Isochrysis_galbana.AAC.3
MDFVHYLSPFDRVGGKGRVNPNLLLGLEGEEKRGEGESGSKRALRKTAQQRGWREGREARWAMVSLSTASTAGAGRGMRVSRVRPPGYIQASRRVPPCGRGPKVARELEPPGYVAACPVQQTDYAPPQAGGVMAGIWRRSVSVVTGALGRPVPCSRGAYRLLSFGLVEGTIKDKGERPDPHAPPWGRALETARTPER